MRVIIVGHRKGNIRVHDTEGNLYDFQHMVGGYIQPCAPVQLRDQGIEMLVNEEGLLSQLPENRNLYPFFFVGNAVLVGVDGENFVGLTQEQQEFALDWVAGLDMEFDGYHGHP